MEWGIAEHILTVWGILTVAYHIIRWKLKVDRGHCCVRNGCKKELIKALKGET